MLNFGASKPRVKRGPRPPGPPGSAPESWGPETRAFVFPAFGKTLSAANNDRQIANENPAHGHASESPPRRIKRACGCQSDSFYRTPFFASTEKVINRKSEHLRWLQVCNFLNFWARTKNR